MVWIFHPNTLLLPGSSSLSPFTTVCHPFDIPPSPLWPSSCSLFHNHHLHSLSPHLHFSFFTRQNKIYLLFIHCVILYLCNNKTFFSCCIRSCKFVGNNCHHSQLDAVTAVQQIIVTGSAQYKMLRARSCALNVVEWDMLLTIVCLKRESSYI